jgi:tetratricopeptide (TPR) repeat protein
MAQWTAFPHAGDYAFDAAAVTKHWDRLHRGDCEALPRDAAVLQAWVLFHNGEFEQAARAGLQAGGDGITAANKATSMYANYLEPQEKVKLALLMEVAGRAEAQQAVDPTNANAWYWQAYALGRYGQGISVAKALVQGLGHKVKTALEHALRLEPLHADAHVALAAFHAEVIDKVGAMIGGMTYGAKKSVGLALYRKALTLNPGSAMTLMEYANGLVMLEGDGAMEEATRLYEEAAESPALDARERLDGDLAVVELQE